MDLSSPTPKTLINSAATATITNSNFDPIENDDIYKQLLRDSHIYIPPEYHQQLVQSGIMKRFINIIEQVNEEQKQYKARLVCFKRLHDDIDQDDDDDDDNETDYKYGRFDLSPEPLSSPASPIFSDDDSIQGLANLDIRSAASILPVI